MDRPQKRREPRIGAAEKAKAERVRALELRARVERRFEGGEARAARLPHEVRVGCGRERGQGELVHAASSFGER